MDAVQPKPNEQATLWNGRSGEGWVAAQPVLDQMFAPMLDLVIEAVPAGFAGRVLDVGCGTGSTTLAIARRLGGGGDCVGVDISEPMLGAARARAEQEGVPASFIRADAQTHAFTPAQFDTIISRLGVMFFGDPVAAFANLRSAAKDDARLSFICWRSGAENPFMTTAERAAAPFLPNIPPRRPDAPGQFAFADRGKVERILENSGWTGIAIEPADLVCTLREEDLPRYFTRIGPLGQVIHEADDDTRARVIDAARAAFDPYVYGPEVRFTAACWLVRAVSA